HESAALEQERLSREGGDSLQVVADEQHGAAAAGHVAHLVEALLLELGIAASAAVALVLCVTGALYFRSVEREFADVV
ncbi:hypothetical protein, partial [Gryllotalpicola sp.]|uniref:hypothetical protein n=1 Tax=Gryllotalpicola sp. TaxID=1932787 RepID=UPI00263770BB